MTNEDCVSSVSIASSKHGENLIIIIIMHVLDVTNARAVIIFHCINV